MFKSELDIAFLKWIKYPGEMLSVLDNETDFESCRDKTHCNSIISGAYSPIFYNDETDSFEYGSDSIEKGTAQAERLAKLLNEQGMFANVFAGYRNNPWFPTFPHKMQEKHPDSFMQDKNGELICLNDSTIRDGEAVAMPAVDDLHILKFSADNIENATKILKNNSKVKGWVAGSEESYPEYFALSFGDFRPDSMKHFKAWLKNEGKDSNIEKDNIQVDVLNKEWFAWMSFREQAMADRASYFSKKFLECETTQPIFYPTHGNLFCSNTRWRLGQPACNMAGACDGLEMGHISIDDDDERVNTLSVTHFTSFGAPVIVPRLGNRTIDFTAQGLGRSFTSVMMRRLVYECLGMGISHIGPIHWRSILHDGEWFIKDTPAEAECRKVFDEVNDAAPILNSMTKLQAQVGMFISNTTWMEKWNPKLTGFFQDSQSAHWNMTTVVDEQLSDNLVDKIPVLISIDNNRVNEETVPKLLSYLNSGGKIIVIGELAIIDENCENVDVAIHNELINHINLVILDDCHKSVKRKLTNEFLSHIEGSFKVHHEYLPVEIEKVEKVINAIVPDCIIKPAQLSTISGTASTALNVYTLTDRSSLMYILINNSDKDMEFELSPEKKLLKCSQYKCFAYYDVMGKCIIGQDESIQINLQPNATETIWVYPNIDESDMESKVKKAINVYQSLVKEGYDVDSYKNAYDALISVENHDMKLQKNFTLANSIINSIFIKLSEVRTNENAKFTVTICDSNIKRIDNANINMRIIPNKFEYFYFKRMINGEYTLILNKDNYPKIYNYENHIYEKITGEVRIIINAKTACGMAGGCIENVLL